VSLVEQYLLTLPATSDTRRVFLNSGVPEGSEVTALLVTLVVFS
jgi:hypothetical protein